jgi:hypothetical protein
MAHDKVDPEMSARRVARAWELLAPFIRPNRSVNVGYSRRPACGKRMSDGILCGTLAGDGHCRLLCEDCAS